MTSMSCHAAKAATLPLLGTIGLVHAVTLAVQQQWLQAPEVAEPLASEIRSSLKYEAATCRFFLYFSQICI